MEQSRRAVRIEIIAVSLLLISSAICWIYSFETMTFSLLFLDGICVSAILLAILRRISLAQTLIIVSAIELPIVILAGLAIIPSLGLFAGIIVVVYLSQRFIIGVRAV